MPTAAEFAEIVTFLASPRARILNGEVIDVSGGTPGVIRY
jgi:NAD(P)-dependent dehydrogenase (short-subunit alcohol dehydrogenase family)